MSMVLLIVAILLVSVTNVVIIFKIPIFSPPPAPANSVLAESELSPTLIVLGAGVRKKELSGMLKCRMTKALELYSAHQADRVLLSGDGTDTHYNETAAMRKFALQNGIVADSLLTDPLGFSTYDSLRRAIEVFGIRKAVIVSQGFHLGRALWIAASFGIQARAESCDDSNSSVFYEVREVPARTKDVLLRWFDFAPRSRREEIF
ncbi:YdcF family protein [bacterium]|nr:YdcF family protein [bacterium]